MSDILSSGNKRVDAHSAPAYTVQDLSKYQSLVKLTGVKPRPQSQNIRIGHKYHFPPLYRLSRGSNGDVEITPHVTLSNLCDNLKLKGLGDPRDQIKPRPPDPLPLLRRRKRQQKKYPFYQEKLKGRALQDMDLTNSKASGFIEQQKEGNIRTASANWRERYNKMQAFDKVSQDSQTSVDDAVHFAAWDEDRKPQQLDEQSYSRIESWLKDVEHALFPTQNKT